MKLRFISTLLRVFLTAILFTNCSEENIERDPTEGLTLISEGYAYGAAARVQVWAEQQLFAGYNKIFLTVFDSLTRQRITDAHIHLNPKMQMSSMRHSCPVENPGEEAQDGLFPAAILFTMPSSELSGWTLEIEVHNHRISKLGKAVMHITVNSKSPAETMIMTAPETGKRYFLAHHFTNDIAVGVNDYEIIAFKYDAGEFIPADDLTLTAMPYMPAMEHGSPNNVHPSHVEDGHYTGKVNFTMTGEWRINISVSDSGAIVGTQSFDIIVN